MYHLDRCVETTALPPFSTRREWNWGAKHYLIADKPGSRITFPFTVQRGLVQLVYQRSPKYHLGNVVCWIDGEENEASRRELEGYWDLPFSVGV